MPSLGFSAQFADAVESGSKLQSIRAPRKRPIVVGDWLALYVGMRQPTCRKLGEAIVESVQRIRLGARTDYSAVSLDGEWLNHVDAFELARADGFADERAMKEWFHKAHGLPFSGHLIRWRLLPREEWRKP